jgi:hypothetical protein
VKEWEYHYQRAEDIVTRSESGYAHDDQVKTMLAKAQVHATLATIKWSEDQVSDDL